MIMMGDKKKIIDSILGPHEIDGEPMDEASSLEAIAQELIEAVSNHDVKAVAECLRAAFAECDAEPHVEGEHIE